jgi:hypothetical protein
MPHIVFYSGSSEKHRIKQVSSLLHAWSVGEQTGGKKLADILSPWQPVVKLQSKGGRPHITEIGRGHTGAFQSKIGAPHRVSN